MHAYSAVCEKRGAVVELTKARTNAAPCTRSNVENNIKIFFYKNLHKGFFFLKKKKKNVKHTKYKKNIYTNT
jgi:hypothetical protein